MQCRARNGLACAALAAAVAAAAPARAQQGAAPEELVRPPSVEAGTRSDERPGAARLAEPPARENAREEVVVIGEQRFRLPDLGGEWRQEEARPARIRAEFFHLYDPNDPTNRIEPFPINQEASRVGFIEIFRIRFGGR